MQLHQFERAGDATCHGWARSLICPACLLQSIAS